MKGFLLYMVRVKVVKYFIVIDYLIFKNDIKYYWYNNGIKFCWNDVVEKRIVNIFFEER